MYGAGHDDCVLSDFGLATPIADGERLTTIAGSPGYSAPEMYSKKGYSLPVDCWSLGCLVFAMMGGRFPYKATDPLALVSCRAKPFHACLVNKITFFPGRRSTDDRVVLSPNLGCDLRGG